MCTEDFAPIVSYLRTRDDIRLVVLAAAWSSYPNELYLNDSDKRTTKNGINLMREGFKEFTASFGLGNRRQFLIISDVPTREPFDVGCLARSSLLLRPSCPDTMFITKINSVYLQDQATDAMIRALPTAIPNVTVSIPHDYLCTSDGCTTVLNNEFLYRDNSHLRRNLTAETKIELVNRLRLQESLQEAASKSRP
jgi:SGNH domain (fused to AT3 domains)